jgi:hypothetical protein
MGLAPSNLEQTPRKTVIARCLSQFFNTLLRRIFSRRVTRSKIMDTY